MDIRVSVSGQSILVGYIRILASSFREQVRHRSAFREMGTPQSGQYIGVFLLRPEWDAVRAWQLGHRSLRLSNLLSQYFPLM